MLDKVRALNEIARARGQTLAQLAIAWVLRDPRMTSALVGASSVEQLRENVAAVRQSGFSTEELAAIDRIAGDQRSDGLTLAVAARFIAAPEHSHKKVEPEVAWPSRSILPSTAA